MCTDLSSSSSLQCVGWQSRQRGRVAERKSEGMVDDKSTKGGTKQVREY